MLSAKEYLNISYVCKEIESIYEIKCDGEQNWQFEYIITPQNKAAISILIALTA